MAPAKKTRQAQCHSLTIEEVPLAKLKPWKENPRKSGATVESVKKSIQTFGFNVPIICTNGLRIVAGHARRKAARSLGLKTVPIIKVSMEDWKADAFAVAENQTASVAEWDMARLSSVLRKLQMTSHSLEPLGFSKEQLDALLTPPRHFNFADFPEDLQSQRDRRHVLLPVKIPREAIDQTKRKIIEFAAAKGINNKDKAVLAGLVFVAALARGRGHE